MWPYHPQWEFPDLPTYEGNRIVGYNLDPSRLTADCTGRSVDFIRKNRDRPFFLYLAHPMPHVPLAVSERFKGKSEQGLYGDVMMELDWSVGEIVKPRPPLSTAGYASNIDILPTFAEIAGAELPSHKIDGVSLLPLLQDPEASPVREALCLYYQENSLEAVTDGTYKLIFPHDYLGYGEPGNDGMPGKMIPRRVEKPELYDMRRDPGERYDVSAQHPDVVGRLEEFADSCRADLGDDLTGQKGPGRRRPIRIRQRNTDCMQQVPSAPQPRPTTANFTNISRSPPKHGIQIDIC